MAERSWEPVRRRGGQYCSPACGGNCSWAAYEGAVDAAARLCATLGKGWEPRVWENLGWYWAARLPTRTGERIEVHPVIPGGSRGVVLRPQSWTAYVHHTWVGNGDTPQAALMESLRMAKAELFTIKEIVDRIEETPPIFHRPARKVRA